MTFNIFSDVRSAGQICTAEVFGNMVKSNVLKQLCEQIASAPDDDTRSNLKRSLPLVTWQASFPNGIRKNSEAVPSGLFMLDIDHVDRPRELWNRIEPRRGELGIVFSSMTPSTKGLRVVAECREEYTTLAQCQEWLAGEMGTPYDAVCKDMARASFLTHESYIYYMDWTLFDREAKVVYANPYYEQIQTPSKASQQVDEGDSKATCQHFYLGLSLREVAEHYLLANGGEPQQGERNVRLYHLASKMRYICDFDEQTLLECLPSYGLPREEMRGLVRSALAAHRGGSIPADLQLVIEGMMAQETAEEEEETADDKSLQTEKTPALPPIFKQWYQVAPDDFKVATMLCQLPILGALGSRLRAAYVDGQMQCPSFQVSLEAPQASGKSFIRRIADYELSAMKEHDERERQRERDYKEKIKKYKLTTPRATKKEMAELVEEEPHVLVRYVPPTMSITQLLIRTQNAQGLHLFSMSEEIDTVQKAFKRDFSNLSDVLRTAWDSAEYGQDYASDTSYSGIVRLRYNTLYSGTPKALRRFYPDIEDGLVSRVTFVTLPDQFGKEMPRWKEFTPKQKAIVDEALERLNKVSLAEGEVQPEHVMEMRWLANNMNQWVRRQQSIAVRDNDRTRDVFCRRSAVVGFRAGMLAWFLWQEVATHSVKKKVCDFSEWIASHMLKQQMLRFHIVEDVRNTFLCKSVFDGLPDTFTRAELTQRLMAEGYDSDVRTVIWKWNTLGVIVRQKNYGAQTFKKVRA